MVIKITEKWVKPGKLARLPTFFWKYKFPIKNTSYNLFPDRWPWVGFEPVLRSSKKIPYWISILWEMQLAWLLWTEVTLLIREIAHSRNSMWQAIGKKRKMISDLDEEIFNLNKEVETLKRKQKNKHSHWTESYDNV